MTVDHFADDREVLRSAIDKLGDASVALGEWAADNMLGDPLLRDALYMANVATQTAFGAMTLAQLALNKLPEAPASMVSSDVMTGLDALLRSGWGDGGAASAMTCMEAEAVSGMFRAIGRDDDAEKFIAAHALGDDDDDDIHHALYVEQHTRPELREKSGDDYITTPTKVRVFFEGTGWSIDGVDDDGGYTELVWDHYGDERMTREVAVEAATEFAQENGWSELPIIVSEEDGSISTVR